MLKLAKVMQIALGKNFGRNRSSVSAGKVIVDMNEMPVCTQMSNCMGTDVSCATSDQYSHVLTLSGLKISW
jgi:hypothetical protein